MKFLIFGGNGFLGSYLYNFLLKKHDVKRVTRKKNVGICLSNFNSEKIKKIIKDEKIDIIVNTIAYTDLDKCEISKEKAFNSNVVILKKIVEAIKDKSLKKKPFLIHISTDQVYSGKGPHKEKNAKPINWYSKTKLKSEKYINNIDGCVLRTNFLGKSKIHFNFNNWIDQNVNKNKKIFGFKNILFSPISMETLAKKIISIAKKKLNGTYNLGSVGGISKGDYILYFLKKKYPKYKKFELVNYQNSKNKKKAKRPLDMRLNSSKIISKFKFKLPKTKFEVNKIIKNY